MEVTLIFPHQLFEQHPALSLNRIVILWEHPLFFTVHTFHVQKIMLHRASMKSYQEYLHKKGHHSVYIPYDAPLSFDQFLMDKAVTALHYADVVDHPLAYFLNKKLQELSIKAVLYETPAFLCSTLNIQEALGNKSRYHMQYFYRWQRKKLGILVDADQKPRGGKWSYDQENRQHLPAKIQVPLPYIPQENSTIKEARALVEKEFKNNPGNSHSFLWPTTHAAARKSLDYFLTYKLTYFGKYQDAIHSNNHFLFHSLLSSCLNTGLLTPDYVISQTLHFAHEHKIPLNSLEGFIRQIIGWREFIRGIYVLKGEWQKQQNYFSFHKKLAPVFWTGNTSITPLDVTIENILQTGYAHHIERLMVVGNFMLLCEINPAAVYRWFMELFIDSYDWVMVPNIYGMSQYADGGLMVTKPYIASSHYIIGMSNYTKGSWSTVWDSLYWHFIYKYFSLLQPNARLALTMNIFKKMPKEKLHNHIALAKKFLDSFS